MRILKESSLALVIDIQERLYPHMDQAELLLKNTGILLSGLKALDIPVILTEQYPKGLGSTLEEIKLKLPNIDPLEKISFSCCDDSSYMEALRASGKSQIIICGIETHVCVMQTVIDLLEKDFIPVVIADCVSSRSPSDKHIALERMSHEGAIISTYESILFELARVAGTDTFKTISKLVK